MKIRSLSYVVLLIGLVLSGCGGYVSKAPVVPQGFVEVARNVYDDQKHNLLILVDNPESGEENKAVADIIAKKVRWEQTATQKRVTGIAFINGDGGGYGHPIILGALVIYDYQAPQGK